MRRRITRSASSSARKTSAMQTHIATSHLSSSDSAKCGSVKCGSSGRGKGEVGDSQPEVRPQRRHAGGDQRREAAGRPRPSAATFRRRSRRRVSRRIRSISRGVKPAAVPGAELAGPRGVSHHSVPFISSFTSTYSFFRIRWSRTLTLPSESSVIAAHSPTERSS